MSAELIERLRSHVRYEYMPAGARLAMEEAADALASKEEEILSLKEQLASRSQPSGTGSQANHVDPPTQRSGGEEA
jgi:hypothetical protein